MHWKNLYWDIEFINKTCQFKKISPSFASWKSKKNCPRKFWTDFIFSQHENLVDNQKCQAEFRPLCHKIILYYVCRSKSLSESFILAATNPQYDIRLLIELHVQYMKTTSSQHVVYTYCFCIDNSKQFLYTICSELVVFMYRHS